MFLPIPTSSSPAAKKSRLSRGPPKPERTKTFSEGLPLLAEGEEKNDGKAVENNQL